MFATSRDILNLTLAVCASVLTILLAWIMIYGIRMMRTVTHVTRRIDDAIRLAEDTLTILRERARDLASVLPLAMKAVDKLITYVGEKRKNKKSSTSRENEKAPVQNATIK